MANVNIKFNGKEFLLSCEDGQEEHLEELALYLNEKFVESFQNCPKIIKIVIKCKKLTKLSKIVKNLQKL